jgi:hypothetical protein
VTSPHGQHHQAGQRELHRDDRIGKTPVAGRGHGRSHRTYQDGDGGWVRGGRPLIDEPLDGVLEISPENLPQVVHAFVGDEAAVMGHTQHFKSIFEESSGTCVSMTTSGRDET